jgi:hypothetical protein
VVEGSGEPNFATPANRMIVSIINEYTI